MPGDKLAPGLSVRQLAQQLGVGRAGVLKAIQRRTQAGDPPPHPVHTDPASRTRYYDPRQFIPWFDAGNPRGRPKEPPNVG